MIAELLEVKRFLGIKFGYGEIVREGIYAVPTTTSKGNAYMRLKVDGENFSGFELFWDEELTISWYDNPMPRNLKQSEFAKAFRKIIKNI